MDKIINKFGQGDGNVNTSGHTAYHGHGHGDEGSRQATPAVSPRPSPHKVIVARARSLKRLKLSKRPGKAKLIVCTTTKKLQLTNKAGPAGKKDKRLYPVEAIHGCYFGGRKGQPTKYLVEWSGYGLDQCSWESLTNLRHVRWSIQQFQRKYGKATDGKKMMLDDVGKRYEQTRITGNTKEGRQTSNKGQDPKDVVNK